jgi:hypothetical protein
MIILYLIAVLVLIVFERQERRHTFYESLEYQRMGKTMPEPKPKLRMLESWLFIVIGISLLALGTWLALLWRITPQLLPNQDTVNDLLSHSLNWGAGLAAVTALTILGFKSARYNRRSKPQK